MAHSKLSTLKLLFIAASLTATTFLINGCTDNSQTQNASHSKKTDSTAHAADSKKEVQANGLTLPVLDALFYEDGFEQELKSKLQLTEQQIRELKTAAHAAIADLNEDGNGDYTGSARNAAKRSEEQINSILGHDKAAQLYQLIGERYASGDVAGLMPVHPNFVPADTRVVVNAPAYRMDVYQEGKLIKTYRVGIGYPEFPLPTGMRRAENIIFNPTWTPPDEPWVKGKVQAGKKVAAGSQLNPLGPIKIPIGLPSLIHGGKAVARLGTFASHGCVGMTDAQVQDFAGVLSGVAGSPMTADSILGYREDKKETKTVKLSKAIPVDLRYETIVAENGSLHIYRDVYERGTNTPENAARVLDVYGIKYESLGANEKAALEQALVAMSNGPQDNPATADNDTAANKEREGDKGGSDVSKKARAKKGKVTRSIVGQKEIVVPVAALKGRGYPAAVNLNDGTVTGNKK